MTDLPPLSLYIHIPWCVRKCPYCDFNSHEAQRIPQGAYIEALKKDLEADIDYAQGRKLVSVFIGGGTPSLFSAAAIGAILEHAEHSIGFAEDVEITLEANPGTAEFDHLEGYRQAGVNRLSFGVQSFHNSLLAALGRIHSAEEAKAAFAMAREAGFDNINIDLMHGLPKQTLEQALSDLEQACALQPEHISWYQLTIEPNTVFYSRPPVLPTSTVLETIFERGSALLASEDYQQYEISAFARSARRAAHNLNYWQFGDYLGIGAGAHSKMTQADGNILRGRRTRAPADYLAKAPAIQIQSVAPNERALEFMLNALRLVDGVPRAYFSERTGQSFANIAATLEQLITRGLILPDDQRIQTSAQGRDFLNDTLAFFS